MNDPETLVFITSNSCILKNSIPLDWMILFAFSFRFSRTKEINDLDLCFLMRKPSLMEMSSLVEGKFNVSFSFQIIFTIYSFEIGNTKLPSDHIQQHTI